MRFTDRDIVYIIASVALILIAWMWVTSRINFYTRAELYRECLALNQKISEQAQREKFSTFSSIRCDMP